MRTNTKAKPTEFTHEGGLSIKLTAAQELRRSVMANMLFEDTFYEDGQDAALRIKALISKVSFDEAAQIAVDAREKMKLRHVPLLIVRELLRNHHGRKVGDLVHRVIQRPDELGELVAIYWRENADAPLPAQLKIGLARALKKFDEYALAKWNKDSAVKLRDVLFLSHARPKDEAQAALFKRIAENQLATPDTWEVELSGGANKRETFERLLAERKLGALALLRNLRGMTEAGVSDDTIRAGLATMKTDRVLPFRFITAARYAPRFEDALEQAMFRSLAEADALPGKTVLLIDHSGSMQDCLSGKSELNRLEAANGLAMILREKAERVRIFTFGTTTKEVPPRRGFGLAQAVRDGHPWEGTDLGQAVRHVYQAAPDTERLIVLTDEQSMTRPQHPQGRGYIINVAGYRNGVAYGPWVGIDGWSEAVLSYIQELERQDLY